MTETDEKILCIDIGGSHIKATIIDYSGEFLQKYEREKTPSPPYPDKVVSLILELASRFPHFDKITAGFPGYVKHGVIKTAPKMSKKMWKAFDLIHEMEAHPKKSALAINDGEPQSL